VVILGETLTWKNALAASLIVAGAITTIAIG
jgi:hypothetical protein